MLLLGVAVVAGGVEAGGSVFRKGGVFGISTFDGLVVGVDAIAIVDSKLRGVAAIGAVVVDSWTGGGGSSCSSS